MTIETATCRNCGKPIYRGDPAGDLTAIWRDRLGMSGALDKWWHRSGDGMWRGCAAATHSDVYPYWDPTLDRRAVAEPARS